MDDRSTPFSHSFDLASLGEGEKTIELTPGPAERAVIAAWAGVDALDAFAASVRLVRTGTDTYEYEATFAADVTQSCVVTLEPVHAHLEGSATRRLQVLSPRARRHMPEGEPAAETGDDETETLTAPHFDVAGPVLEEFALSIDPYPRAQGAVFEAPVDSDKPANPFSALGQLKGKR